MPSTVLQNYEQSGIGQLQQVRGLSRVFIGDSVATRILVGKESGALSLFDMAAGVVYTLPTPVIGMTFEFYSSVTITSNAAKVITAAATEFLLGAIGVAVIGAADVDYFAANGTTHRAITSNGTTTGGIVGSRFRVTAISNTQWLLSGMLIGSGTQATPVATS